MGICLLHYSDLYLQNNYLSSCSHFFYFFTGEYLVTLGLKYARLRLYMVSFVLEKRISQNLKYNLHRDVFPTPEMKCSEYLTT